MFADTKLGPGEDWASVINSHLAEADVGVVLVSAALLASDFVMEQELPAITNSAEAGRLTLVWAVVSAAAWEVTPLARFQAALDPRRPLDSMSEAESSAAVVTLAKAVSGGRAMTEISAGLGIADRIQELSHPTASKPSVVARHTGTNVVFESRDERPAPATIEMADLEELTPGELSLVSTLRESMEESYARWSGLRPRRNRFTQREKAEYEEAGTAMCDELRNLLDFIEYSLDKPLYDHYNEVRYACDRLID